VAEQVVRLHFDFSRTTIHARATGKSGGRYAPCLRSLLWSALAVSAMAITATHSSSRRNNLLARANSDSLAYFLGLSRFVLSALFGALYVLASATGPAARWVALCSFSALSLACSSAMARGFTKVQAGIRHSVVEQNHAPTPWLWQMTGGEVALTLFATIAFTVPSDAASAIVVLVVTMTSSATNLALLFCGGVAVVLYLRTKLRAVHEQTKGDGWLVDARRTPSPRPTPRWLTQQGSRRGAACWATCWAACQRPRGVALAAHAAHAAETMFGRWLRQWVLLVAILSVSAVVLFASAGTRGLGIATDDDAAYDDDGGGGGTFSTGLFLLAGLLLVRIRSFYILYFKLLFIFKRKIFLPECACLPIFLNALA
jgi:hypothetical protein